MSATPTATPQVYLDGHLFSNGSTVYLQVCKGAELFKYDVQVTFTPKATGITTSKVDATYLTANKGCSPGIPLALASVNPGDTLSGAVRVVSPASCAAKWDATCSNGVATCGFCFYAPVGAVGTLSASCKFPQ